MIYELRIYDVIPGKLPARSGKGAGKWTRGRPSTSRFRPGKNDPALILRVWLPSMNTRSFG